MTPRCICPPHSPPFSLSRRRILHPPSPTSASCFALMSVVLSRIHVPSRPFTTQSTSIIPDCYTHMHTRHRHHYHRRHRHRRLSVVCCFAPSPRPSIRALTLIIGTSIFLLSFLLSYPPVLITPLCLPPSDCSTTTRYRPASYST